VIARLEKAQAALFSDSLHSRKAYRPGSTRPASGE
jgi:hypothetical protein